MSESVIEETEPEEIQPTEAELVEPVSAEVMSEDTAEPGENDEGADVEPDEGEQQQEAGGPAAKARKEAARYRAQLRTLEGRANAMRDQLIEHELGADGVKLAALTAAGVDLDSLFGEDGRVSPEAVQAAAATARETLGIPNNRFQGTADQGGGRRGIAAPKAAPTWGNLLDPTKPQVNK